MSLGKATIWGVVRYRGGYNVGRSSEYDETLSGHRAEWRLAMDGTKRWLPVFVCALFSCLPQLRDVPAVKLYFDATKKQYGAVKLK